MDGEARGAGASDDARWIALLELITLLEEVTPGISDRLHRRVAKLATFTDIVRLYGPRMEPRIRAAYAEAEQRLGVIAVVAPRRMPKGAPKGVVKAKSRRPK